MDTQTPEPCPHCGGSSALRHKLLLIDEAWVPAPGKDSRLAYAAYLRVDDVKPSAIRHPPLEQFVDGYYCEKCGKGFVPDAILEENRRRYR